MPFEFVSGLAAEFGAMECYWRESDALSEPPRERSLLALWFRSLPSEFAVRSAVVGYSVLVRCVPAGPGRFAVSVPVTVPGGVVRLGAVSRGSRVQLVR